MPRNKSDSIDTLDRAILKRLLSDSRTPYNEIAKEQEVSVATIHTRIDRLKKLGVIEGSKLLVNYKRLGYDVCALIGINVTLESYEAVVEELATFDEVVEIYHPTGKYAILIKVFSHTNWDMHLLLTRLQKVKGLTSSETFVIMHTPLVRDIDPTKPARSELEDRSYEK